MANLLRDPRIHNHLQSIWPPRSLLYTVTVTLYSGILTFRVYLFGCLSFVSGDVPATVSYHVEARALLSQFRWQILTH